MSRHQTWMINQIFFFRKISLSTKSGSRHDLVAVTISPAVLNTLSIGTDVPGILSNDIATAESRGNVSLLSLHHSNGFSVTGMLSHLYCLISLLTLSFILRPGVAETTYTSPKKSSIAVVLTGLGGSWLDSMGSAGSACLRSSASEMNETKNVLYNSRPMHEKTTITNGPCWHSKDSDQPGHQSRLIRVLAEHEETLGFS